MAPKKLAEGFSLNADRKLANDQEMSRTTIVIPNTVDRNLAIWCAQLGISKSDFIKDLVCKELSSKNLQPERFPRNVVVSY